ncbi:MAG: NAD-dependent epimerase/dehydratase family protein [Planctomycetota bacterium]|jgi:nucleoside-diphosphate-sugar epimerase
MKALVTGASGFVGSHLTEALLKKGVQVRALVRGPDRLRWVKDLQGLEKAYGSLEHPSSLARAIEGVDLIFHVAGVVKAEKEKTYFAVNAKGTENLIEAALRNQDAIKRFVYVSSQAAAGPSSLDRPIDEDDPPRPITPYGRSKLEGERIVLAARDRLAVTVIRPPAVFGPRDVDIFLYFKMARQGFVPIPGFGKRRVSAVYVLDLVQGILLAAENPKAAGKTYFITSGDYDWIQIAGGLRAAVGRGMAVRIPSWLMQAVAAVSEAVGKLLNKPVALNRNKARELVQRAWLCSMERARKELGYHPAWPLETAMASTAAWYRDAGWIKR